MVPCSAGVDAFCVDWKQYLCWIVPPLSLVAKTILYLKSCKAKCTLIVPKWESATYWPLLVDSSSGKFKYFIRKTVVYFKPKGFFVKGSVESIFSEEIFPYDVIAFCINFDCQTY